MRVRPTPALGIIIGILYIVSFIGLSLAMGGVITDLTSVERIAPFLVALGVSAAWLVVVTSVFGWWRPVLRDRTRVGGTLRVVPVVWIVVIGVMLVGGQGWTLPVDRLMATLLLGALVGFSEELAYRGLALVGLRGGGNEQRAFLVATVLFALLHLPNALLGAPVAGAVTQVIFALLGGVVLYTIRRTTGLLVMAMVFHAAWDISTFISQNPALSSIQLLANIVLVVLIFTQRKTLFAPDQEDQLGVDAHAPAAAATA